MVDIKILAEWKLKATSIERQDWRCPTRVDVYLSLTGHRSDLFFYATLRDLLLAGF